LFRFLELTVIFLFLLTPFCCSPVYSLSNDSINFYNFQWTSTSTDVRRIEVDIYWTDSGGNTFVFLDGTLANGIYVTVGLRDSGGVKRASMSVFKPDVFALPGPEFTAQNGGEGDTYCIGDYPFNLGEYYRLILDSNGESVSGYVYRHSNSVLTKICKFYTGTNSIFRGDSWNSVSLEHYGMADPSVYKSRIYVSSPVRMDIYGTKIGATGGYVGYQTYYSKSDVDNDGIGHIIISHGGDTINDDDPVDDGYISWPSGTPDPMAIPPLTIIFHTDPSSTGNITCGSTTEYDGSYGDYYAGDIVTITANPPSGYSFLGWLGTANVEIDDADSQTTNMHVYGDGEVTALFNPVTTVTNLASLVVRGSNNIIYYRTYNITTDAWSGWNGLPGATCDSPAATVCGNELHVVVRSASGSQLYQSYVNLPNSAFSGWLLLSGSTPSAPTLTGNGTHLCLVVRGENNRIYHRLYSVDSRAWTGWSALPSGSTGDSLGATMAGNQLHIVVRGMGGSTLYYSYRNLDTVAFSGWTLLSGSTPTAPTLTANSTHLSLVVRGSNNRIYYRFCSVASHSWGGWNVLPSGSTNDRVATAFAGDKLQFVVRGSTGGQLYRSNVNLGSATFSGWSLLSGSTPSPPTLTS